MTPPTPLTATATWLPPALYGYQSLDLPLGPAPDDDEHANMDALECAFSILFYATMITDALNAQRADIAWVPTPSRRDLTLLVDGVYVRFFPADTYNWCFECHLASWREALCTPADVAARRAKAALDAALDRILATMLEGALWPDTPDPLPLHQARAKLHSQSMLPPRLCEDVLAYAWRRHQATYSRLLLTPALHAAIRAASQHNHGCWGVFVVRGCPSSPRMRAAVLFLLYTVERAFGRISDAGWRPPLFQDVRTFHGQQSQSQPQPQLFWTDEPWAPGAYRRLSHMSGKQCVRANLCHGAPIVYFQPPGGGDDRHILESATAIWLNRNFLNAP